MPRSNLKITRIEIRMFCIFILENIIYFFSGRDLASCAVFVSHNKMHRQQCNTWHLSVQRIIIRAGNTHFISQTLTALTHSWTWHLWQHLSAMLMHKLWWIYAIKSKLRKLKKKVYHSVKMGSFPCHLRRFSCSQSILLWVNIPEKHKV